MKTLEGQIGLFDFQPDLKTQPQISKQEQARQEKKDKALFQEQKQDAWDRTHPQNIEPNGILPCENCGGIPRIEQFSVSDARFSVVCECGVESVRNPGSWLDLSNTRQEAIDHWNKGYRRMNPLQDGTKRTHDEMFKWDFDTYRSCPQMLSMFKRVLNKATQKVCECYYQIEQPRVWMPKPCIQVNEKRNGYISVHQYQTIAALVEEWDFPELEQWAREHYEG